MGEWFNTGDLMTRNERGQYLISGRASDLVFGEDGENLNPDLAEQVFSLPHAVNFTVTGDKDNETLILVIQIPQDLTEEQRALLLQEIADGNEKLPLSYKIKEVYFTFDSLLAPKEIKISRAKLRKQIADGTVRLFDSLGDVPKTEDHTDESPLKAELRGIFAEILEIAPKDVTDTGHFMNDLGGSSLDYFTLIGKIDETYGVTLEFEMENFTYCLNDFVRIIGEQRK